jgi:hypothetical protein
MNESVVKNTQPGLVTDFEGNWQRYSATHALARNNTDLKRFVDANTGIGTTVAVDSFAPSVTADKHYEFERNSIIWEHQKYEPVELIKTLNKMPTDVMFDNVVLLGSESFKYMTVPEYCKTVADFLDTLIINGNAIVCLPILHLQYHRLRYNTQQIVKHIDQTFVNYSVQDVYRDQTEFYLKITREI